MSLNIRKRGTLAGLALLCTAAGVTTGAFAATPAEPSVHVSYVAATIATPQAAEALYARIQRAARSVCSEPNVRDLGDFPRYQACYDKAVDNAVAKVGASALTALHRSKTQRSAAG